jgi:hypothetical protein
MFQMILGPITAIASTYLEGRNKKAEAKAALEVAKLNAESQILEKKVAGEIDWDITQAKASQDSWKDEWLTLIFTLPILFLLFGEEERVNAFFIALGNCPEWYQYLLGTIVAASFGFRGAAKIMKK